MKTILLLYEPISQKHLVDSIIRHTLDDAYEITGFNVTDWKFNNGSVEIPLLFKYLKLLKKIPYFGSRISNYLLTFLLIQLSRRFDYIDVSFFTPLYYRFLTYLIKIEKPYKITIWGSDFYRSREIDLKKKRYYLNKAKIIQVGTYLIKQDVLKVYPEIEKKIAVCNYGIDLFDKIDANRNNKILVPKAKGKIVTTCGYNASKGQQHYVIISALQKLPKTTKDKIFVFFPMTYGSPDNNYINDIEKLLRKTEIPFYIFRETLSDDNLSKLRLQTDIVLNIQVTDALSASITEHLYAGNILIAGEWLPYSIFSDYGIKYITTSIDNIVANLNTAINTLENLQVFAEQNIIGTKNLASWDTRSSTLKNIFLYLSNNVTN